MTQEIYKKYRPKDLNEIVGQDHIVKPLSKMLESKEVPHTILFCGPKGTGKTTTVHILKKELKCSKWDFTDQDCGQKGGIDTIRDIERNINLVPMKGKTRIWVLNECHQLSAAAQNSLLDMTEFTPKHAYFFLCTTDPQKLLPALRSRCTIFACKPINGTNMRKLLQRICKQEKLKISEEVEDKIISNADGSARNALVLLNSIKLLTSEEDQLETIASSITEKSAIEIARTIFNPRAKWIDMCKLLKETKGEEPESIRNLILSYANTILLSGGKQSERAFEVIQIFRDNWYDCKNSGLSSCCYEAMGRK